MQIQLRSLEMDTEIFQKYVPKPNLMYKPHNQMVGSMMFTVWKSSIYISVLNAQLYAVSDEAESSENICSFKTIDLLCWASQVTQGMQYMAKLNVLHGDLAARNILLCADNVVKICDFGLARSLYQNGVYCKKGTVYEWNIFGFPFLILNFYRAQKRRYHSSGWHSSQLEIIHLAPRPMFGRLVSFCGSYFHLASNHTLAWKQENHFIYNC